MAVANAPAGMFTVPATSQDINNLRGAFQALNDPRPMPSRFDVQVQNPDGTISTRTYDMNESLQQLAANTAPLPMPPSALQDVNLGMELLGDGVVAVGAMAATAALATVAAPEVLAAGAALADVAPEVLAAGTGLASDALEFSDTPAGRVATAYGISQLGDTGLPPDNIWDFIGSNLDQIADTLFGEDDAW